MIKLTRKSGLDAPSSPSAPTEPPPKPRANLPPHRHREERFLTVKQVALRWQISERQSLLNEIEAYRTQVTTADPLAEDERRAIKPVTLRNYLNNLRWHLSRLVEAGVPVEHFTSLAAGVDVDLVKRSLALRLGNKELDDTTKPGLSALMTAIISVAHFLGVSDEHYRQLKRLADKVRHRPQGMTERNKERPA